MTRIALLNVKYSPNLGDGIIAECLEHELTRIRPEWQVESIDLAGRESFGSGLDSGRGKVLNLLDVLPSFIRRFGAITALSTLIELRYRKHWRRKLDGVRGAIVGGGQLFADADLNFPLKLNAAINEVSLSEARLAVFGVGVAESLSKLARRLFLNALRQAAISHVAVRDSASRYNWNRHFGRTGLPDAALCSDPGLLAADVYPSGVRTEARDRPEIGIGIVNPRTLDLHASDDGNYSVGVAREFWIGLATALVERGYGVTLFTNGPFDDELFLESVLSRVEHDAVKRAPRSQTPSQLADTMRGFDAVVAHRLHANIVAYAFRIPHVGLSWDPKVDAFFDTVGRRKFVANHTQADPEQVADLVKMAIAEGIEEDAHAKIIEMTRKAIKACADDLAASIVNA